MDETRKLGYGLAAVVSVAVLAGTAYAVDPPKSAQADPKSAKSEAKAAPKPAKKKSTAATKPKGAKKGKEAKEKDDKAGDDEPKPDKAWDSAMKISKDAKGQIDTWKPPASSVKPILEEYSALDKALGEPPAREAREQVKVGPRPGLGEAMGDLEKLAGGGEQGPSARAPRPGDPRPLPVRPTAADLLRRRAREGKAIRFGSPRPSPEAGSADQSKSEN
jgi:hypothetical protein